VQLAERGHEEADAQVRIPEVQVPAVRPEVDGRGGEEEHGDDDLDDGERPAQRRQQRGQLPGLDQRGQVTRTGDRWQDTVCGR
jgi:hypothetical protein